MDTKDRLELTKLIKQYDVEDTTTKIRKLKHSNLIRQDILTLENLKKQYSRIRASTPQQFRQIAEKRCAFLYEKYTNIFNKVLKDELNLQILARFLVTLEKIEMGVLDQHEGSFEIGSLLKELYIDSAIKGENNFQEIHNKKQKEKKPTHNISWKQFKVENQRDEE